MDTFVKTVLPTLSLSGIIALLTILCLYKVLDRKLDEKFKIFELNHKAALETAASLRKKRLEKTAELLPLLQKNASECRLICRNLTPDLDPERIKIYNEKLEEYTDVLYGAHMLLLPQTYELAHRLKMTFDQIRIRLSLNNKGIKDQSRILTIQRNEIERFYNELVRSLAVEYKKIEEIA